MSINKSPPNYLEIINGSINKGSALEAYCRLKHIPLERTLAFGDNYNDMDMFNIAGTNYAMANTPEEIREKVGNVTADHDHDGIAAAIQKLFP